MTPVPRIRGIRAALSLALACAASLTFGAQGASADLALCPPGGGAGQCANPRGLATDSETDRLYVAEADNHRVSVFEASTAEFLMAFGWDVVESGPGYVPAPSEEQLITLQPGVTSNWVLEFESNATGVLPPDASASSVQTALNRLPGIDDAAGSVTVSGSDGGPYTVFFGGSFAEDGVPEIDGSRFPEESITITTLAQGGAFEICKPASGDTCKAGSPGPGAGQLVSPRRLAVDNTVGSPSRHEIYVVDDNRRVNRFAPDGSFVHAFGWGVDTGAKELEACTIASICESGLTPLAGEANECQLSNRDSPIAIGPAGNVFVADNSGSEPNFTARVEEFSPAGACLGETRLLKGNFRLQGLAIDASEDAFVAANGALRKYDLATPETKLCDLDPGIETNGIAFDEAGHLFASQREFPDKAGGVHQVITEYDVTTCPPTKHVRRFGYRKIVGSLNGLAVFPSAQGDIFGSAGDVGNNVVHYLKLPPPGPLVANVEPVLSVGNVRAKIRAEFNPEGKASEAIFEFVDDASFQQDGFEGPNTKTITKAVPMTQGAFRANALEAILGCEVASQEAIDNDECLTPSTLYHWRVDALNPDGGGEPPVEGQSFETAPPVQMEVFATGVAADTATLNAQVNPLGIPTTGFFEYVDQQSFEESGFATAVKVPNVDASEAEYDFGSGEAPVKRSATVSPLSPGTTFRYRLSAQNAFFTGLHSEEKTITTFAEPESQPCPNDEFRNGAGALLPDCRAYEMVSPLDKAGGDVVNLSETTTTRPTVLQQAAISGDRLAYGSYRSFGDAESAAFTTQYIAARDAAGWQSHGIDPPHGQPLQNGVQEIDSEFRWFSGDLCESVVGPLFEPPLAEAAIAGFRNYYRRTDELCGPPSYQAITTAEPQDANGLEYKLELQGRSADGAATAFAGTDGLEGSGAPPAAGTRMHLYVKGPEPGPPRFACILPGGSASTKECSAGTSSDPLAFGTARLGNFTNALSEDGTHLYWTDSGNEGKLYLRENPLAEAPECAGAGTPCTVPVSEAAEALSGADRSQFWAAAEDGSSAIFNTGDFTDLIAGTADLYRYTAGDEATQPIAADVFGFVGASNDASRVYFASGEAIAGAGQNNRGDEAVAGEPNLYLYDAGEDSYRFVTTLAKTDVALLPNGRDQTSASAVWPIKRSSRVSEDGLSAAFMSAAPITGYDNTDAKSPVPCGEPGGICDTEVFVYDAGTEELVCASCNPSGGRPAGADVNIKDTGKNPFWIAARLTVWETALKAPQLLSEDGNRLFFESQDPLVARDTNSRLDVYQWERAGRGGCEEGDPTFSPENQGCIDLISSGKSLRDSLFVDASREGDDVFFNTLSSLVPQDYGLLDIYDARVGGGLPPPPAPERECEGESCQTSAPTPTFGAPATATYQGPGDLKEAKPKQRPRSCAKGKRRVSKRGKSRCVGKRRAKERKGATRRSRSR